MFNRSETVVSIGVERLFPLRWNECDNGCCRPAKNGVGGGSVLEYVAVEKAVGGVAILPEELLDALLRLFVNQLLSAQAAVEE